MSHSMFEIPIVVDSNSTCYITRQRDTAEVIRAAGLIVLDEAAAQHKHCADAVNRTFRDILDKHNTPFRGEVVVFGGDFRQRPPAEKHGSRSSIVSASLRQSNHIWPCVKVLRLSQNTRLSHDTISHAYSEYTLRVGDGEESSVDVNSRDRGVFPQPESSRPISIFPGITRVENIRSMMHFMFQSLENLRN